MKTQEDYPVAEKIMVKTTRLLHICCIVRQKYGRSAYQMTALVSETFFVWFRVAWEVKLESYGPRHASVILWYNILCICCKLVHTSLFGVQLCITTKLMYLMTAYYTSNDGFIVIHRAKLASYTTRCSVFSINRAH